MKRYGRALVCGMLAVMVAIGVGPKPTYAEDDSFVMPEGAMYEPEVALVSVQDGASADDVVSALAAKEGVPEGQIAAEVVSDGVVRVELAEGMSVEDAVNDLKSTDVALDAQPNWRYVAMEGEDDGAIADQPWLEAAAESVNDPYVGSQWGLASVKAFDAWSLAKVNGSVTVAIFDLGCDVSHPDLKANIVAPYNAYNALNGGSTSDVSPVMVNYNHGTHVAGIIGAVSNNGEGVSGVSYNAHLMPVKVSDANGDASTQTLLKAYDYVMSNARAHNVRVVNLSMGTAGRMGSDDVLLRKVDEAYSKGIVTVSCAGNKSSQGSYGFPYPCYPSDHDKIVSVMNLRKTSAGVELSDQSNYNISGERNKNISAPGANVYSTTPNGSYGTLSGTSMATPYVSAVLALEFAANPSLGVAEAVNILYSSATDLGTPGWDETYGWGEVNAYEAVRAAKGPTTPVSTGVIPVSTGSGAPWLRLSGANRYDTMSLVVEQGFSNSSWAVVATGANYPDALAASALAGTRSCPVVLTDSGSLSAQAASQIKRLHVGNAYLMGGAGAASEAVEAGLRRLGVNVTRVQGPDRQATSLQAYKTTRANASSSNTVIVATGSGFADALSIGPWAYATSSPVLLTKSDGTLSAEAADAVKADAGISRVVIVGGANVVSDAVRSQLGSNYTYVRLEGPNRYATSRAIAEWELGQGTGWSHPVLATGKDFPDALAGAALGGAGKSPLLLAASSNDPTLALERANASRIQGGFLLGGENAVPSSVAEAL